MVDVAPLAVTVGFAAAPTSGGDNPVRISVPAMRLNYQFAKVDAAHVIEAERFTLTYTAGQAVWLGGGTNLSRVEPPPFTLGFTFGLPTVGNFRMQLSSPEPGAVVATARPQLIVGVTGDDNTDDVEYILDVQWADNDAFSNPTTVTQTISEADGGAVITPETDLPATTFWRARLREPDGDLIIDWTPRSSFTIAATVTSSDLPLTWTLNPALTASPHLWHFNPPGARAGELVTIYGHGFPAAGSVRYGDDEIDVERWELVAAASANTAAERIISGADVTCEHWEIDIIAPVVDDVGDVITVED